MITFGNSSSSPKACPKGSKRVVISSKRAGILPGSVSSFVIPVQLEYRIEEVIGVRVIYANICKTTAPTNIIDGNLVRVVSNTLGSFIGRNNFQVAAATDSTLTIQANEQTFCIGLACNIDNIANTSREPFHSDLANPVMYFAAPKNITLFDVGIASIGDGMLNLGAPFTCEIILEFVTQCRC